MGNDKVNQNKSRIILSLLTLIMLVIAALACMDHTFAASTVKYLDDAGKEQTAENCISVSSVPDKAYPTLVGTGEKGTWYVLDSNVTYSSYRLTVLGKVNLILMDGYTLNAAHGIRMAANRSEGADLTVYAQSTDVKTMGVLRADATGYDSNAGIGGNDSETSGIITINGGKITATGGECGAGIGGGEDRSAGSVTINGGDVTANGGKYGAGIGGGEGGSGGTITITGGIVNATGGYRAAGIGGGQKWSGGGNGGNITISNATVTTTAGNDAAGIGGGQDGEGGTITIHSGNVTATGGSDGRGAGIGGGVDAHAGNITINGGTVKAIGGVATHDTYGDDGGGAGIGAGYDNDDGSKTQTAGGHVTINGGDITAVAGYLSRNTGADWAGAGIGSGAHGYGLRIEIHGGTIDAKSPGCDGASIGGGYKSCGGHISIDNHVSDPTVYTTTCRGYAEGHDNTHCIGSGMSSDEESTVEFDYPTGKVWVWSDIVKLFYPSYQKFIENWERADAIKRGEGWYREIRIMPCEHAGKTVKAVDGGHKISCKYCSVGDTVLPHEYGDKWDFDENKHWKKCSVCGFISEEEAHNIVDDKCKCGLDYNLKLSDGAIDLKEGDESASLSVTTDVSEDKITWKSSDENVATVAQNGKSTTVSPAKAGTCEIKVSDGTRSTVCQVTVEHVHKLRKVQDMVVPTCTEDGKREFYWCDEEPYGCNRTFFDEEGTDEFDIKTIDSKELIIPANGHQWEWESLTEPTQRQAGEMKRKCGVCGEEETITTVKASPWAINDALNKIAFIKANVAVSTDGSDVYTDKKWASAESFAALEKAQKTAETIKDDLDKTQKELNDAAEVLEQAIQEFSAATQHGTKPVEIPEDDPVIDPDKNTSSLPKASDVETKILTAKSNEGPSGTVFAPLALRSVKQTKKSIKLKWNKAVKAVKYVIYGNLDSKKYKMKKIATVKSSVTTKAVKKAAGKKLKKGKYYKFIVMAVNKNGRVVSLSKVAHVAVKGGKKGNYKKVTVKKAVITKAAKLRAGKSLSLKAKAVKASNKIKIRKYRGLKYLSSNKKVATVSSKGVIKAKAKGTCYVYAYAQNGVYKKIKVVVK